MDADGAHHRVLVEGNPDPDWSPAGRPIALSRPSVGADGQSQSQIWLMNTDGSHRRPISHRSTFKAGPSWSPDGTEMVYILLANPGSPTDPQPQVGMA
jgi:Tol biopolymer transport system component